VPTREDIQPEIQDGAIECWFRDDAVRNHEHSDFWHAEPELTLFLLRSYQEDGITGTPGSALDPVLAVWRIAESLLHSARMARHVNADHVEFFARWDGLENRELRSVTSDRWHFPPELVAHNDRTAAFVHTSPEEIDHELPSVVRALVSPLFEAFGLFDPPGALYATEIATMLERTRGHADG
jgi:transcriptional regulator with XRE-family HTH domain